MREFQLESSLTQIPRRDFFKLAALSTTSAILNAACSADTQPRIIRGEGRNASEWIRVTDHQRDEHVLKPILDLGLGNTLSSQNPISIERSVQNSGTAERWSVQTDSPLLAQGLEVTVKFPKPITDDKPERLLKPLPEEGMRQLPSEVTITSKLDLNALPEGLRPEDGKNLTYDQMQLILKLGLFKSSSESKVSSITENDGSTVVRDLSTFNYVEPASLTSPIVPAIGGVALFATGAYLWRAAKERFARPMTKKIVPEVEEDEFGYPIAPIVPISDYEDEQIQQSQTAMRRALASQRSNRRRLLGAIALGAIAGATYNAWDHWETGYATTTLSSDGAIEHKMYYSNQKPDELTYGRTTAVSTSITSPAASSVVPSAPSPTVLASQESRRNESGYYSRICVGEIIAEAEKNYVTGIMRSTVSAPTEDPSCGSEAYSGRAGVFKLITRSYDFLRKEQMDLPVGVSGNRIRNVYTLVTYYGADEVPSEAEISPRYGLAKNEYFRSDATDEQIISQLSPDVIIPADIKWQVTRMETYHPSGQKITTTTLSGKSVKEGLELTVLGPDAWRIRRNLRGRKFSS